MRLLSSETKDWKSRAVSEAEQTFVCKSAEPARKTTKIIDKQYRTQHIGKN